MKIIFFIFLLIFSLTFFITDISAQNRSKIRKRQSRANRKLFFKDESLLKYLHNKGGNKKNDQSVLPSGRADFSLLISLHPTIKYYNFHKKAFNRIYLMIKDPVEIQKAEDKAGIEIEENLKKHKPKMINYQSRKKEMIKNLSMIDATSNYQIKSLLEEHRARIAELTDEVKVNEAWREYKNKSEHIRREQILSKERARLNMSSLNEEILQMEEQIYLPVYTSREETALLFRKMAEEVKSVLRKCAKEKNCGVIYNYALNNREDYFFPIKGGRKFILDSYEPMQSAYEKFLTRDSIEGSDDLSSIYKNQGNYILMNQSPEIFSYIKAYYALAVCSFGFEESLASEDLTKSAYTKLAKKYGVEDELRIYIEGILERVK